MALRSSGLRLPAFVELMVTQPHCSKQSLWSYANAQPK
jgi:hypothetical protein